MDMRVYNVKGDGHCYYRCIWNIAKNYPLIAEALMINDKDDEAEGAGEVRYYVALSLRFKEIYAVNIVRNLVALYKDLPDIVDMYPILNHIKDIDAPIDQICVELSHVIENTNVMASSLEHEIIAERLSNDTLDPPLDCKLVVLAQLDGENVDDLADKWLRQLDAAIGKVENEYVVIIVNQDNIHYKYAKILGEHMVRTNTLREYIKDKMECSTDSD
jgi:hypothetical protein